MTQTNTNTVEVDLYDVSISRVDFWLAYNNVQLDNCRKLRFVDVESEIALSF